MDKFRYRSLPAVFLVAIFTACTQQQPRPQELKQKTAEATAEAKSDVKAVAQGIKQGWNSDNAVDLNTASKASLAGLPGMTEAEASHVIAGRPYHSTGELVTRSILPKTEYDQISDRITVK